MLLNKLVYNTLFNFFLFIKNDSFIEDLLKIDQFIF